MPTVDEFDYAFDALADVTADLLAQLGLDRYAIYVRDDGAPIGWRLALRNPAHITAIITQNGNAHTDGFVKAFWDGLLAYASAPGPDADEGSLGPVRLTWLLYPPPAAFFRVDRRGFRRGPRRSG